MNRNIFSIAGFAALMLLGTTTFAQGPQGDQQVPPAKVAKVHGPKMTAEQKADNEIAKLDEVVHLAPEQKTQLHQLFLDIINQKEQNKAAAAGDPDKFKDLNKGLAKQRNQGVKRILTKDQQVAWKQAKQEKKAEKRMNAQPQPGGNQ